MCLIWMHSLFNPSIELSSVGTDYSSGYEFPDQLVTSRLMLFPWFWFTLYCMYQQLMQFTNDRPSIICHKALFILPQNPIFTHLLIYTKKEKVDTYMCALQSLYKVVVSFFLKGVHKERDGFFPMAALDDLLDQTWQNPGKLERAIRKLSSGG